jgi:hypothetical protein
MSDPDDGETVICYGAAKPCDVHLASRIVAVDDEILKILDGRERRVRALRGQHEEMRDSLTVSRGATIRR